MKNVLFVFITFFAYGFRALAQSDSALAYRTPVKTFEESVED